jgi:hypothetical protein
VDKRVIHVPNSQQSGLNIATDGAENTEIGKNILHKICETFSKQKFKRLLNRPVPPSSSENNGSAIHAH